MNAQVRNRTKRESGDSSAHSRELVEENGSAEGDGKMKTKLLSMWTNMKYGKLVLCTSKYHRKEIWYHNSLMIFELLKLTSRVIIHLRKINDEQVNHYCRIPY